MPSRPLILTPDPSKPLLVQVVDPPNQPMPTWWRWLVVAAIFCGLANFFLWSTYVQPRVTLPPVNVMTTYPLAVAFVQPAYIAFGQPVELDVTVTNHGVDPISGIVAIGFTDGVIAQPFSSGTNALTFKDLAREASVKQRIRMVIPRVPKAQRPDDVRVIFHAAIGTQRSSTVAKRTMAISPIPLLHKANPFLFSSAFLLALFPMIWDVLKARILKL